MAFRADLKVHNPWHLSVETIYESVATRSCSSQSPLLGGDCEDSKFLDSDILKTSYCFSIPSAVWTLSTTSDPPPVQKHLDLSASTETEEKF